MSDAIERNCTLLETTGSPWPLASADKGSVPDPARRQMLHQCRVDALRLALEDAGEDELHDSIIKRAERYTQFLLSGK
jgi:hypothetical protein